MSGTTRGYTDAAGETLATDTAAAIGAGVLLAAPDALTEEVRFYSVLVPGDAQHALIDLEAVKAASPTAPNPVRKTGTAQAQSPEAFASYLARHETSQTEVWADPGSATVTAVFDAHDFGPDGLPGWGGHRLTYELTATDEWRTWLGLNGKLVDQLTFAEHLEDNAVNIVAPPAADLLEIAQHLEVNRTVQFTGGKRVKSGQTQLEWRENEEATSGKGSVAIPDEFAIALKPYEGSDSWRVTARLRYRIGREGLRLSYKLVRPKDVQRVAFDGVIATIADAITPPILTGTGIGPR